MDTVHVLSDGVVMLALFMDDVVHPVRVVAPIAALVLVLVVIALSTVQARRRGYAIGGEVVVRCRQGHLFATTWIPGASFKSIRLGWIRYQRCPVGHHWSFVRPVRESDLTEEERKTAHEHKDTWLP